MTAAPFPAPADLAIRGAAHAAADRVLTLLGVPVAMEVDLVEGPADDPGVLMSFGHASPGSRVRVVRDAHRR